MRPHLAVSIGRQSPAWLRRLGAGERRFRADVADERTASLATSTRQILVRDNATIARSPNSPTPAATPLRGSLADAHDRRARSQRGRHPMQRTGTQRERLVAAAITCPSALRARRMAQPTRPRRRRPARRSRVPSPNLRASPRARTDPGIGTDTFSATAPPPDEWLDEGVHILRDSRLSSLALPRVAQTGASCEQNMALRHADLEPRDITRGSRTVCVSRWGTGRVVSDPRLPPTGPSPNDPPEPPRSSRSRVRAEATLALLGPRRVRRSRRASIVSSRNPIRGRRRPRLTSLGRSHQLPLRTGT